VEKHKSSDQARFWCDGNGAASAGSYVNRQLAGQGCIGGFIRIGRIGFADTIEEDREIAHRDLNVGLVDAVAGAGIRHPGQPDLVGSIVRV